MMNDYYDKETMAKQRAYEAQSVVGSGGLGNMKMSATQSPLYTLSNNLESLTARVQVARNRLSEKIDQVIGSRPTCLSDSPDTYPGQSLSEWVQYLIQAVSDLESELDRLS